MKFIAIFIVLTGLGTGGYFFGAMPSAGAGQPCLHPANHCHSRIAQHPFVVNAAGDIGPADQFPFGPRSMGALPSCPSISVDKVKKNALLCRLDDKDLQIERSQRLAEIDGARFTLQKVSRVSNAASTFLKRNSFQSNCSRIRGTEFDLLQCAATGPEFLNLVEQNLTETKIQARFDCTVLPGLSRLPSGLRFRWINSAPRS